MDLADFRALDQPSGGLEIGLAKAGAQPVSKVKRKVLIIFLLAVIAASALVIRVSVSGGGQAASAPHLNVLVVSVCSLRFDRLGVFNPDFKGTPKIDEWAKGAFRFTNGIAERPWQNYTYEGSDVVKRHWLGSMGYRDFPGRFEGYRFYVPPVERLDGDDGKKVWFWPQNAILNYGPGLEELKAEVTRDSNVPFYIFTHLKYLHYPYLDSVNMHDADFAKLPPKSRELLAKYRAHPEKYDVQLPLIELLTNSFDLLKKKLGLKNDVFAVAGVVSDPIRNAKWRESPGFKDDLQLVKDMYDLKMPRFDDMAADILNLYGDKDLQARTVVIFTGDHGESFSEHGVIGHSVNVYDEMLRFPLVVKFPGQRRGEVIDSQMTHLQLAKLARGIVEGRVTAANFAEEARKASSDIVLSRNCPDTIRSARLKSEWKFIKNLDSGQNELYNLKSDPGETRNIINDNGEIAWRLEEYMVDHEADLQRENRNGVHSRVCTAN
jgi:hypothetical protein